MKKMIMAVLLTVFMLGATPAMAHQPGVPAQAGRLAACSNNAVNVTKATVDGVALKKYVKVRTVNKNGKHFHINDIYERSVTRSRNLTPWRLVGNDKPATCGTAKIILAPGPGRVNI